MLIVAIINRMFPYGLQHNDNYIENGLVNTECSNNLKLCKSTYINIPDIQIYNSVYSKIKVFIKL